MGMETLLLGSVTLFQSVSLVSIGELAEATVVRSVSSRGVHPVQSPISFSLFQDDPSFLTLRNAFIGVDVVHVSGKWKESEGNGERGG